MPSFRSTAASTVNCCLVRSLAPGSCENKSFAYCTQRLKRCDGACERSKPLSVFLGPFEAIPIPQKMLDYIYDRPYPSDCGCNISLFARRCKRVLMQFMHLMGNGVTCHE